MTGADIYRALNPHLADTLTPARIPLYPLAAAATRAAVARVRTLRAPCASSTGRANPRRCPALALGRPRRAAVQEHLTQRSRRRPPSPAGSWSESCRATLSGLDTIVHLSEGGRRKRRQNHMRHHPAARQRQRQTRIRAHRVPGTGQLIRYPRRHHPAAPVSHHSGNPPLHSRACPRGGAQSPR